MGWLEGGGGVCSRARGPDRDRDPSPVRRIDFIINYYYFVSRRFDIFHPAPYFSLAIRGPSYLYARVCHCYYYYFMTNRRCVSASAAVPGRRANRQT